MKALVKRLRAWLERDEALFPAITQMDLEPVYQRSFPGTDRRRFYRLWCRLAFVVGRDPLELREDDRIIELCDRDPDGPRFLSVMDLVAGEAGRNPLPEGQLETVGAVIDYLLKLTPT